MKLDHEAYVGRKPSGAKVDLLPARPEDLDDLVAIRSASFDRPEQESRSEISRWLRGSSQRIRVAQVDGATIGMVRIAPESVGIFINSLAVAASARGRGLGRAVLDQSVTELIAAGEKDILLEVETENRGALSLYLDCGFRETSTYRYYALAAGRDPLDAGPVRTHSPSSRE